MNQPVGSVTKRPHYVPAVYLRAWADESNRVAVRRRASERPFVTAVVNVGVEAGLYGRGDDAIAREEMFGRLEDDWPRLRARLIDSGDIQGEERDEVALFMALQFVRTSESIARRNFVASVAEHADERTVSRDTVRRFLAEKHLGFEPRDAEVEGAWSIVSYVLSHGGPPTRDEMFNMAVDLAVKEYAPKFSRMVWAVETCRKRILFTSNRPVMCWRPKTFRDRFEGISIDNANEIRLPLRPDSMLVLRRQAEGQGLVRVEPRRFAQVNIDIAAQCFNFVVTRPRRIGDLGRLQMAVRLPSVRFNMAPGWQQSPDGYVEPMGDVIHQWVPVRET